MAVLNGQGFDYWFKNNAKSAGSVLEWMWDLFFQEKNITYVRSSTSMTEVFTWVVLVRVWEVFGYLWP